jgi:hypothetical protein
MKLKEGDKETILFETDFEKREVFEILCVLKKHPDLEKNLGEVLVVDSRGKKISGRLLVRDNFLCIESGKNCYQLTQGVNRIKYKILLTSEQIGKIKASETLPIPDNSLREARIWFLEKLENVQEKHLHELAECLSKFLKYCFEPYLRFDGDGNYTRKYIIFNVDQSRVNAENFDEIFDLVEKIEQIKKVDLLVELGFLKGLIGKDFCSPKLNENQKMRIEVYYYGSADKKETFPTVEFNFI